MAVRSYMRGNIGGHVLDGLVLPLFGNFRHRRCGRMRRVELDYIFAVRLECSLFRMQAREL